jgi:integrase
MATIMLTDTLIKSLKAKDKSYSISDANGLYIEITPKGSKYWRQSYRFNGKQKKLAHGVYPRVSLAKARELRDKALDDLQNDTDPAKTKRQAKTQLANTFGLVAKEWHEKQSVNWKPNHSVKVWRQLEADVLPYLRDEPIDKISVTDLLEVLQRVEKRGALDIASRQRQRCEAIFKHAILSERASYNPATQLVGVLKTKKVEHRKALDRKDLPAFFDALESIESHAVVKLATKMLAHTFVRTGELRNATWDEFDFDERLWHIPAERMKMDADHYVPLTDQTIRFLKQLKEYNGKRIHVFASPTRPKQALSNNAILNLLYRMGYKHKATGHGFRATASTILNEQGYNPDAIERQLAHIETNKIRAAYNRSEYMNERVILMQDWSNYLDSVSAKIVPINSMKKTRAKTLK